MDSEDISLIPRTSYPSESSSFNVHGVLYVEDSGEVAPVEAEIRALSTGLQGVKDEQEYIVVRERVHRDSECRESTASFLIEGELAKWLGLGLGISSGGIHRKYSFVMGPRAVSRDSCCFFLSLSLSHPSEHPAERPSQMVVNHPEFLARRHLRVERDLPQELVRSETGVVDEVSEHIAWALLSEDHCLHWVIPSSEAGLEFTVFVQLGQM